MEVASDGGADAPDNEPGAQSVLFVLEGRAWLSIDGQDHDLGPGAYAYIPAHTKWRLKNAKSALIAFILV